jgi:hypothetical protein
MIKAFESCAEVLACSAIAAQTKCVVYSATHRVATMNSNHNNKTSTSRQSRRCPQTFAQAYSYLDTSDVKLLITNLIGEK